MAPVIYHEPLAYHQLVARNVTAEPTRSGSSIDHDILEAWAEGFYVGALIILILIVLCNIKKGVLLHKLILLEVRWNRNAFITAAIDVMVVDFGNLAWHFHFLSGSSIWLVSSAISTLRLDSDLTASQVS